ncbi:hypothetical protein [Streptomyces sp. JW3]
MRALLSLLAPDCLLAPDYQVTPGAAAGQLRMRVLSARVSLGG